MKILIAGAAGNLGTLLARSLLESPHQLRLMTHTTPIEHNLDTNERVEVVQVDLGNPSSLVGIGRGVDCIVHVAGRLFEPRPATFLPHTNVTYVENLIEAAIRDRVQKFILISFPQVEGETSIEAPARGSLDADPPSVHAKTRLRAEKALFGRSDINGISLRSGLIYGRGVKMIEAARWLMARRLLGVWPGPTWYQLIALPDFIACVQAAIEGSSTEGIYHLGDDQPITLQHFLDVLAEHWGYPKPWRLPGWTIYTAAAAVEAFALIAGAPAPLHRDFIRIGMVSHYGDTTRMRQELLADLEYPTLEDGLPLL